MKKSTLLLTLASIALPTYAQQFSASPSVQERDPLQNEASIPNINQKNLKEDLLRKQHLSQQSVRVQTNQGNSVARFTGKQLAKNPALLERLFLEALVNPNKAVLPVYIQIYESVPNADRSLIDWAKAILEREDDLNKSVASYRKLISDFPENNFIRYQLAETLFYNQEYEAAKTQFERLRASTKNSQDVAVFDKFIEVIDSKENWNFSFSTTFLNDKNLANSAKQGTKMTVGSGEVTYNTPRQTGKGLGLSIGVDKRWSLSNGKYIAFDNSVSSRYYWDNKKYNEFNGRVGAGFGYQTARFEMSLMPFTERRWYAGGSSGSESMKQYSKNSGARLDLTYWLNEKWQISTALEYGEQRYITRKHLNGNNYLWSNTLSYFPKSGQFWFVGADYNRENTRDEDNAYQRKNLRLGWGQEWGWGISTRISLAYARRTYKGADLFNIRQKNNEYQSAVTLWHRDLYFWGITPKITWSYQRVSSNHPFYSYDKNRIFLEMGKTF